MKTKPRPAQIVLGVSFFLLISSAIWFVVAGFGSSGSQDSAQIEPAGTSRTDTTQESVDTPEQPTPNRIGEVVPQSQAIIGSVPIGLEIPAIGVRSEVIPVGVDQDRQVEIPDDISQVGWYRFGATPGTGVGSSVIVGHRDGRNFGLGAFYELENLKVGDPISVTNEAGDLVTYQVTGVESIKKSKLPLRELFREDGAETLTLISCIGYYEPGVGYEANIIVSAEPDSSSNAVPTDSTESST